MGRRGQGQTRRSALCRHGRGSPLPGGRQCRPYRQGRQRHDHPSSGPLGHPPSRLYLHPGARHGGGPNRPLRRAGCPGSVRHRHGWPDPDQLRGPYRHSDT